MMSLTLGCQAQALEVTLRKSRATCAEWAVGGPGSDGGGGVVTQAQLLWGVFGQVAHNLAKHPIRGMVQNWVTLSTVNVRIGSGGNRLKSQAPSRTPPRPLPRKVLPEKAGF